MEKIKKGFCVFSLIPLLFCLFALPVSANSPMPADHLWVVFSSLPDGAVYADLLIRIHEQDSNYVDFQPSAYGDEKSDLKEIADYSEEGYRSFSLHYKNAKSNIKIEHLFEDCYAVEFCSGLEYGEYLTQYEDLMENYRSIKIAILDENYKILSISDSVELPKEEYRAINFYGEIEYDPLENKIAADISLNPYFVIFGSLFSIVGALLSVGIEFLVALLFRFRERQLFTILVVNIFSQIIMRTLYLLLPLSYLVLTIILEALVYTVESIVFIKKIQGVSAWKIVTYTTVANTLSLLIGVWVNGFILA